MRGRRLAGRIGDGGGEFRFGDFFGFVSWVWRLRWRGDEGGGGMKV